MTEARTTLLVLVGILGSCRPASTDDPTPRVNAPAVETGQPSSAIDTATLNELYDPFDSGLLSGFGVTFWPPFEETHTWETWYLDFDVFGSGASAGAAITVTVWCNACAPTGELHYLQFDPNLDSWSEAEVRRRYAFLPNPEDYVPEDPAAPPPDPHDYNSIGTTTWESWAAGMTGTVRVDVTKGALHECQAYGTDASTYGAGCEGCYEFDDPAVHYQALDYATACDP